MNPFKHKQLEEFTIADCELYISKYPYGEHLIEVEKRLRNLRKAKPNKPNEAIKPTGTKKPSKPKKEIFALIGNFVVVIVVGTIIIVVLNEILPYDWWNKYRYIICPAGLALGRWLQKEFNW